ncbi:ATP-binding protein [Streptomyces sp. MK5]|uniref:ATP-binding protein n=1 Tax=Streptomyces sp. MK5 TaxID=3064253 RepID=UPI002741F1B7|nr:ATP-binding protein [Streptomyces sp. MK5]
MHTTLFPFPGPTGTSEFAMAFTSTPRGARLARLFVAHCLDAWGHPYDSDVNETLTLITAELCAEADGKQLRLEVSDDWDERRPAGVPSAAPDAESGRGLLLVTALADDWASPTTVAAPARPCGHP